MKRLLILLGGVVCLSALAIVAVAVIQWVRSDDPGLKTEAPAIDNAGQSSQADVRRFTISPAESSAKYVVEESLRGLTSFAVGTTSEISGDIYLTREGLHSSVPSRFVVDLSKLQSDEGMRDTYIKQNTLQTARYPNAEFVIESVEGFPVNYVENTEVPLTLHGTLTVRDVSQPVTWQVLARQAGNTLTATADTQIKFTDFNMTPPSVPIATARDDIRLQVVLIARESPS